MDVNINIFFLYSFFKNVLQFGNDSLDIRKETLTAKTRESGKFRRM
jgi:hypothetical protein